MTMTALIPSAPFGRIRHTGTYAIVAGFLGIVSSTSVALGYFGASGLTAVWIDFIPWVFVITFGYLVRFLSGERSAGASIGLAVFGSMIAGPTIVSSAGRLRWLGEPTLWPNPSGNNPDFSEAWANTLVGVGSSLLLISAVLLGITIVAPVIRLITIRGRQIARSAFRIEVLVLLFLFAVSASLTADSAFKGLGTYSSLSALSLTLSWVIPIVLVLSLALRTTGVGSIWAIAGLALAMIVEPMLRTVFVLLTEQISWLADYGDWYQQVALSTFTGLSPSLVSIWALIATIALITVVLVWNAQSPLPVVVRELPVSAEAPLDPWAGTAFILAFVPLLSIPAILLGHISYERIVSTEEPLRGRIVSATAIVIAILNTLWPIILLQQSLASATGFWIGG